MKNSPIDAFELTIDKVDVATEGDDIWLPELVEMMAEAGFTMKGGIYVMLSVSHPTNEDLCMSAYVPVARRIKPRDREPDSFHEGNMPKFMNYCSFNAFRSQKGERPDWGASLVNSIIATNYGNLPEEWLSAGMTDLNVPGVQH